MSATRVDPCGCDEALDLRRQVAELEAQAEGLAVEVKQYRLGNEKLRELARELVCVVLDLGAAHRVPDLLARAKALGVEAGR